MNQIIEQLSNVGIIYMFTSPSNKHYIGQSINFKDRYRKYKNSNTNSIGIAFKRAIKKYKGIENFQLTILDKIQLKGDIKNIKDKLNLLEIFYIDKHKTFGQGYNLTAGGKGSFKRVVTEETRKKLSEANKGKRIKEKIEVVCSFCEKKIYLKPYDYNDRLKRNKSNNMYCSRNCQYKSMIKK